MEDLKTMLSLIPYSDDEKIKDNLGNVLKNPNFMPDGGTLGYGCMDLYQDVSKVAKYDLKLLQAFNKLNIESKFDNVVTFLDNECEKYVCDFCKKVIESDIFYQNSETDNDVCLDCFLANKQFVLEKKNIFGRFKTFKNFYCTTKI